jgi:hypothetical protein
MIPGYAEAILEERRRRNRSEFQIPDTVCGVELRPLTLHDIAVMQESGICFFDDSDDALDAPTSLVMLLWWQWTKRPKRATYRQKRRFARQVGRKSIEAAEDQIEEWLKWQFADAPPGQTGARGSVPITSFAVSICDSLASRCSWARSEIMNMALPIIWQHLKLAAVAENPRAPRFNPSDRVKSEFLLNRNKAHA